jgi:hypothetical protein
MTTAPLPLDTRIAIERGGESLTLIRNAFVRGAQAIARYEAQYMETSDPAELARILNWAILHASSSVLPNARIELAADAQAELMAVAAKAVHA